MRQKKFDKKMAAYKKRRDERERAKDPHRPCPRCDSHKTTFIDQARERKGAVMLVAMSSMFLGMVTLIFGIGIIFLVFAALIAPFGYLVGTFPGRKYHKCYDCFHEFDADGSDPVEDKQSA